MPRFSSLLVPTFLVSILGSTLAFDNTRNDNLAVYYGQNSYGATHPSDSANFQKNLAFYCGDNSIDAFPLAFLDIFFGTGGQPSINLANICNDSEDPLFPGTDLPNCQFMASDIQTCQSKGKIVTISLGGATGANAFSSDSQAQSFADQIWNLFLGGSSSTRPFGSVALDGVDLDIEGGGTAHYAAFVNQLRSHFNGASKKYYVTGAPQCPYPDGNMQEVLNAASFDAVYVQFYNNYCGVNNAGNPNDWDFSTWDNWAKTVSPNKNVKIYIGAPASSTAAGSGYIDAGTLGNLAKTTRSQYSSFGGVMLWDASQAYNNGRYDAAIKSALSNGGGSTGPGSPTTTTTPTKPTTTTTTAPSNPTQPSGSCSGVEAWTSSKAYVGGSQVTYNGHLWTAKWWSEGDAPGGSAGDWTDDGACTSSKKVSPAVTTTGAATSSAHKASVSASIPKASSSAAAPKASASTKAKEAPTKRFRFARN